MILEDIVEFAAALPGHRAIGGLDLGTMTIGVAVSDNLLSVATPLERLSTVAAERALLEADTSRKRRSEVIDHVAAGYILQGVLDRLGHLRQTT